MAPLPRKQPSARRWGSSWPSTVPPAAPSEASEGSSGSIAIVPVGVRTPRWSGRSRMHIDGDRDVQPRLPPGVADGADSDRQTTAVISASARGTRYRWSPGRSPSAAVVDPDVIVRPDVEDTAPPLRGQAGQQHREAVAGDAQVVEHRDAVVALVLSGRPDPVQQGGDLRQLRDAGIDGDRVSVSLSTITVISSSSSGSERRGISGPFSRRPERT